MSTENVHAIETKLGTLTALIQHLLALELAKNAVSQQEIGKHLHVRIATVNKER